MAATPEDIAAVFVAARRQARAVNDYPGAPPQTLAEGYAIQDAAIRLDGRPVAAWKVGRIPDPLAGALGANRLCGPVFAGSLVEAAAGEAPVMPAFAGGFAAVEGELLLHVAPGWNGEVPTDDAGTRAIVDDLRLSIEIAGSPYPGINDDGPCVTVSDFGNNVGSVIGERLAGWKELDLCAILVRTTVDGTVVGEATAATMLDGPYGAVRFLLAHLLARGIDASGGFWVSTGAITGAHRVAPGSRATVEFVGHGEVACRIAEAQPRG